MLEASRLRVIQPTECYMGVRRHVSPKLMVECNRVGQRRGWRSWIGAHRVVIGMEVRIEIDEQVCNRRFCADRAGEDPTFSHSSLHRIQIGAMTLDNSPRLLGRKRVVQGHSANLDPVEA